MSIQLEMTVTGGELARALLRDEEELAYALQEMARSDTSAVDLGAEIVGYLHDWEVVAVFLRALASSMELHA